MASQEELDRAKELREIENDRVGISGNILDNLRSASNVVSDTVSKLKFEKQERSDIRSITRELNKVAKDNFSLGSKELGTSRNLNKLAKDQEKIQKSIANANKLKEQFSKSNVESEFQLAVALEAQVKEAEQLSAELSIIQEESSNIANNFGVKGFAIAEDIVGAIPGLRQFKGTFSSAADSAREVAAAGKGSVKAFAAGAKSLASAATAALPLLILNTLVKTFSSLDKQSGEVAKNLGISYNEAIGLAEELSQSADFTDSLFINSTNLLNAQVQISQVLGTNVKLNQELLKSQVELTKQAGYSVETATLLSTLSLATGNTTEDITKNFLGQTVALNAQNKVQINSKQLLESISKTSKGTLATFADQPKELAKAAFQARKLGLEISTLESIADGLLDIESSLTAEFEAEVISGRQLNLERARFFALTNDIAGVGREIEAQGITQEKFAKATRIEQDALAKAVGLSRDQLGESLILQKGLAAAGVDDEKTAREKFETLKAIGGEQYAINELGKTEYARQLASVSAQEKFVEVTNKLRDAFVGVAGPLLEIINPIVSILAPVLTGIANTVNFLANSFSGIPGVLAGMVPLLLKASMIAKSFAIFGFKGAVAAIFRTFASIPFGLGIPLALGAVGGLATLVGKATQSVNDGMAPASKGPFTITDSFGSTAITAKGDGLAVSPNIQREGRNQSTSVVLSDAQIQKIANAVRDGASRATINLDGDRVSSRLQTPMITNTLPGV